MKDRPKIRSLNGLEAMPQMTDLGIYLDPYLSDLSALSNGEFVNMTKLSFVACRNVTFLDDIVACAGLRVFDASEGSVFPSLWPLVKLANLEGLYLYGKTRVEDGDLNPLLELPHLSSFAMMNRRYYKPSVKEVEQVIAARQGKADHLSRNSKMNDEMVRQGDDDSVDEDDDLSSEESASDLRDIIRAAINMGYSNRIIAGLTGESLERIDEIRLQETIKH
jgi:hypothetical protein